MYFVYRAAGKSPHVIINHLHRDRMDPNCDIERACFNNALAEDAYTAYHGFIEQAQRNTRARGLLLDIHGQVISVVCTCIILCKSKCVLCIVI